MKKKMGNLEESLIRFFEECDLEPNYLPVKDAFLFFADTRSGTHQVNMMVQDDPKRLTIIVGVLGDFEDLRVPAVLELVSRINARISPGHFDLFYDTREVNFRVTLPVMGQLLSSSEIEFFLDFSLIHVSIFEKAFMRVLEGELEPKEALASCIKPTPRRLKRRHPGASIHPDFFSKN